MEGETVVRLAGSVELGEVLRGMHAERPVFHSEADLQHAFAWAAHELDANLHVRLETHPEPGVRLDLLLSRPDLGQHTAVELKYLTSAWTSDVGGERFELKNQGAQDIRAYDVVKDIQRVEGFVAGHTGWNGLVLAFSNYPSYWTNPGHMRETNAGAFRLHEGNLLDGVRAWGPMTGAGTMKGRERELALREVYRCEWSDYSDLGGSRGRFRLLTFIVGPTGRAAA
jgi:hypothetical protein